MSNRLIPFDQFSIKGNYNQPTVQNDKLAKCTVNSIVNAWDNNTVLDNYGRPWINSNGIHTVLRTTRDNANYLVAGLSNDQKCNEGGNLYVRGEAICYLLDLTILNARSMLRENYVKYSQLLYIAIRDCSRARELRGEYYEFIRKQIKTLKRKRINEYQIDFDELTDEPLHGATAEFSHIRSVSIYPELASHMDNGLIVNKNTHDIITRNGINDENELLSLCDLEGWDTSWYHEYSLYTRKIGC